jgi:AraC-like DNA-binding protein
MSIACFTVFESPRLLPATTFEYRMGWTYSRPTHSGSIEVGTVRGRFVALSSHFHDDRQLTFVMAGRRRFVILDRLIEVAAGYAIAIAPGVPHRSLQEDTDVCALNLYLPGHSYDSSLLIDSLRNQENTRVVVAWEALATVLARLKPDQQAIASFYPKTTVQPEEKIEDAASRCRMSREGFSRRFKKTYGIGPKSFQMAERLNQARRLLREGAPISSAALQTGFSDQSHLGRLFLRSFGTTPKRYSDGSL